MSPVAFWGLPSPTLGRFRFCQTFQLRSGLTGTRNQISLHTVFVVEEARSGLTIRKFTKVRIEAYIYCDYIVCDMIRA